MRTYDITFSGKTMNNYRYHADKEGFRDMRGLILRTTARHIDPIFIDRLVNLCDNIAEMNAGEEMHVILSKFEPYSTKKGLQEFNRTVRMMDDAVRNNELGENYLCEEYSAFVVKRTEKIWKFAFLCADVI